MELIRGVMSEPQRIVLYGPEGIGKSSFAAQLPDPVFIDVEGSTSDLDVIRTQKPSSWRALCDTVVEFTRDHHGRKSLIIDTADWAERLCIAHVCSTNNMTAIGGNDDFGKSYNLLETEWCRLLDSLSRLAASGMHVCLTAHAKMRKFEVPDQDGGYDRWELKLERKTAAATKEWARTVLFLRYKTYVVAAAKKTESAKGKGGHRVMQTTHNPCWDAKNRAGLEEELPMEYSRISQLFLYAGSQSNPIAPQPTAPVSTPKPADPAPVVQPPVQADPAPAKPQPEPAKAQPMPVTGGTRPAALVPLLDLMRRDSVTEHEIQLAVAKRGYYPADTPLDNYDPQFVSGRLVAHWPKVIEMVNQVRQDVAL